MTRLDIFLKNSGLFKQRSGAKRACVEGRVRIGGQTAKASHSLAIGDVLCIDAVDFYLEAEILDLPSRPLSKSRRHECYRLLTREQRDVGDVFGFDDEI